MGDPRWMAEARKHIGQREIAGSRHNPLILRWWTAIRAPFTDDETPWCAGYVGGCLEAVGLRSSRSAMARSYSRWGVGLSGPAVGAVVVFSRPPSPTSGHVAFVAGRDRAGNLMVLGGNQKNMVRIDPFALGRVVGYRWPADEPTPALIGMQHLPVIASDGRVSTDEA